MSNLMPQGDPHRPDLLRELESIRKELRALWNRKEGKPPPKLRKRELIFSYPGEPDNELASPPYVIPFFSGTLMGVRVTASTPGSGPTTVRIYINSVHQETVTLAGGDTIEYEDDVMLELEEDDVVQVKFDSIGAGLTSPVVQMLMSVDSAED